MSATRRLWPNHPSHARTLEQAGLALLGFGAIFAFASIPVDDYDGSLYTVVARHLLEDGTFFHLRGLPGAFASFTEHPPFFFWLLAGVAWLGGEQALPWLMGLIGAATALLGFVWARRRVGHEAAWLGCVLLMLLESWSRYQARARIDPLLALLFTVSVIALFEARGRARFWMAGGLAAGLGALCKGPPALGAPVLAALLLALDGRAKELARPAPWVIVACGALGPPLAFLGYDTLTLDGLYWRGYVDRQLVASVNGQRLEGHTNMFRSLVSRGWVALPFVLVALGAPFVGASAAATASVTEAAKVARRPRWILLAWALFVPAGFSLASRGIWHYNTPAYLPWALLGGVGATDLLWRFDAAGRLRALLRHGVLGVGALATLAVPCGWARVAQNPHRFGPLSSLAGAATKAGDAIFLVDPESGRDLGDQIYLVQRSRREVLPVTPLQFGAVLASGQNSYALAGHTWDRPRVAVFRGRALIPATWALMAEHHEWALAQAP